MLKDELLDFISERAGVGKATLDLQTPLFSEGLLDSLAALEVTAFVERKSGIRFAAPEINLDNLDTIGRILDFVESKRRG